MHGFLTRDGVLPAEFLRLARADLAGYPTITLQHRTVTSSSVEVSAPSSGAHAFVMYPAI
jgi:hypothetical protein